MNIILFATTLLLLVTTATKGQQKTTSSTIGVAANNTIPVSNADLGTFPYFKTFPNFRPLNQGSDSITIEHNRTYFFDGRTYFTIDGQVSAQRLSVIDDKKKNPIRISNHSGI